MFVKQLKDLTTALEATQSHFMRCIKPNVAKKAGVCALRLALRPLAL